MEKLEKDWNKHPILHLDLNIEKYDTLESLDNILEKSLTAWEKLYGAEPSERSFSAFCRYYTACIRESRATRCHPGG